VWSAGASIGADLKLQNIALTNVNNAIAARLLGEDERVFDGSVVHPYEFAFVILNSGSNKSETAIGIPPIDNAELAFVVVTHKILSNGERGRVNRVMDITQYHRDPAHLGALRGVEAVFGIVPFKARGEGGGVLPKTANLVEHVGDISHGLRLRSA
jgi:hypothetical protein